MDRKEFVKLGCCAFAFMTSQSLAAEDRPATCDPNELTFIKNWVTDLMETIDAEPDEATKIRLMSGCGRGCFKRFQFKQDIAAKGKGDVSKLVEALKQNFEVWREGPNGELVHIRYGEKNINGCYCPAAKFRPGKKNDIHCYCTRAMHQAIWETALGHPVRIDILQTVRRGDPTCHFLVQLKQV
jgi:hypothetical protein